MADKTDTTFHYPPELFNLVANVIPRLVKSKNDVILFFKGAGVPDEMLADWRDKVRRDRGSVNKYEISGSVIERLNDAGERMLRQRRELRGGIHLPFE